MDQATAITNSSWGLEEKWREGQAHKRRGEKEKKRKKMLERQRLKGRERERAG